MEEIEKIALSYLSKGAQSAIKSSIDGASIPINEIRLRLNKPLALTIGNRNIITGYRCSLDDLSKTVAALCQGSLYSYEEYIKEGVIPTEHGIRAGVCGRAVVRGGVIDCVRDITSINLRIPHRVFGASDSLYKLVVERGSVLVFSKPGLGKTTLLRELLSCLANKREGKRVAVIDTRYELSAGGIECDFADVFLGYPRRDGIVTAVKTMSPEYIICDEISNSDDAESILFAYSAGVKVVASTHAGSYSELLSNSNISRLISNKVFAAAYWIKEVGYEVIYLD